MAEHSWIHLWANKLNQTKLQWTSHVPFGHGLLINNNKQNYKKEFNWNLDPIFSLQIQSRHGCFPSHLTCPWCLNVTGCLQSRPPISATRLPGRPQIDVHIFCHSGKHCYRKWFILQYSWLLYVFKASANDVEYVVDCIVKGSLGILVTMLLMIMTR